MLLVEQLRPLPAANPISRGLRRYIGSLERSLNAGRYEQGTIAWIAAVAPPVLVIAGVSIYLAHAAPPLALLVHGLLGDAHDVVVYPPRRAPSPVALRERERRDSNPRPPA